MRGLRLLLLKDSSPSLCLPRREVFSGGEAGEATWLHHPSPVFTWTIEQRATLSPGQPIYFAGKAVCTFKEPHWMDYRAAGEEAGEFACQVGIQSLPSVCSQVGWQGRVLPGGSPMALTACHREITATCLSVHNADGWPVQHGPARWSCHPCPAVGRLWQLTRHLGRGRQGPEHCYLYRHQDLLLPGRRAERRVEREESEHTHTHTLLKETHIVGAIL